MAKTEATRCNLTALRKATRRVSQLYDQALATSGLRGTQRAILVHVRRTGAPTMGELAAALVLDRTALNHNLKPLARDGLLTITVDKNDRRSRLVRLTKRGEARLAESQAAWLEAQDRFETAFGTRQAADLRQTLELVAALEFGEPAADVPVS
ncbi:MarR family winged helix-turn-helix transcriptional regulator [Bradyrhizobium acaciae]|uniref:MarR family winged helix-turn-helix transcriptional regulator n=1 Tax=Bradyrhizobium acaciae TaxID=2683706 RepID=UPI001E4DDDAE|nr:MarR family winged helix-turn-helix transcriptional regulator [Bradyrhizobium acaciae]MCC8981696.1 winged helix-turn-helix transcriptional regulator [Bradyrhizobium acaciae]